MGTRKTVGGFFVGKVANKLISKDAFGGYNQKLGKEVASFVAGEMGLPAIGHSTETVY